MWPHTNSLLTQSRIKPANIMPIHVAPKKTLIMANALAVLLKDATEWAIGQHPLKMLAIYI